MEAIARLIDTGTDELRCEVRERVAVITLNRPQARNSLSDQLSPALREVIRFCAEDAQVGAVMITGAGAAFCAGGDVKGMGSASNPAKRDWTTAQRVADLQDRHRRLTGALVALRKPTLAALPGPAAGAGLSIALACDLRVASASVKITTAFAKVGLSGDYGGTYFLTQMLGSARARELYLMSPVLTAPEALALGLVTKVVPDAEVDAAAHELAMSLAQGPSVTLGYIKKNINNAEHMSLEACFDAEAMNHSRSGETADHKEAAKAFVEKRKPVFQGH